MNIKSTLRWGAASLLLVACLVQATSALAGTTGGLRGTVTDESGVPIAGAVVTVISASGSATTTTAASGRFVFLSLQPDTYTVSAQKTGYEPFSVGGETVFADQQYTVALLLRKSLKTIAHVTARSATNLVKAGTTADVYSVNGVTASQLTASSGGHNLDSAYASIYSQPGVTSYIGNFGFGQVFYIRGASYAQTGYEFDGVPVNRAFDNYQASSLSNLGSSEVEVYTGGSPASGTSNSLGGYINQVIKTGTNPGTAGFTAALGGPAFYHKADFEVGGATPDRNFSYYAALRGVDQTFGLIDTRGGDDIARDGSDRFGLQGYSINPVYGFLSAGSVQNGPWATCVNHAAPAGGAFISPGALSAADGLTATTSTPACIDYLPLSAGNDYTLTDRQAIANLHFGIPHRHDSGRDDVQLLYDGFSNHTAGWGTIGSMGGPLAINNTLRPFAGPNGVAQMAWQQWYGTSYAYPQYGSGQYDALCSYLGMMAQYNYGTGCATNGASPFMWGDGAVVSGASFGQKATSAKGVLVPYLFPGSPLNRSAYAGMPTNVQDGVWNDGAIVKLQYQRNFGSRAFVRALGYSFYSDWLQSNPNLAANAVGLFGIGYDGYSKDYELNTHTRGLQLQFADQMSDKHMVTLTANYTTATSMRYNNLQAGVTPGTITFATLQGANGTCYSQVANIGTNQALPYDASYAKGLPAGSPVSCLSTLAGTTLQKVNAGALPSIPGAAAAAGAQWIVTANTQQNANVNEVIPRFLTASLEDEIRPNDKLDLNLGVRFERYQYGFANSATAEAAFWLNQINATACVDPLGFAQAHSGDQGSQTTKDTYPTTAPGYLTTLPGQACPLDVATGRQLYHPGQNGIPTVGLANQASLTKTTQSPRLGVTYTINPDTVLRATFGRYVQPTQTAYEQVLTYLDGYQLASAVYASRYYNNGFGTTVHDNPLQYSNNADFSLEKHLKGTDMSFKLSPYYRYTSQQLVFVNLPGGLNGAFNDASQRSSGIEFQIQKGDPARQGWSGSLSYTLTRAKVKYAMINGTNMIKSLQNAMLPIFNLSKSGGGAPCYSPSGNGKALACSDPTAIVNPYYNLFPNVTSVAGFSAMLNAQYPLDGWYPTYANYFPYGLFSGDQQTSLIPNSFAGFLAYRHGNLQAAVNMVLAEGTAYGNPVDIAGIDPRYCYANQGSTGVVAGSQYADYQTCTTRVVIPNPTTGQFDSIAQYRNPWQLNIGGHISYDISPRMNVRLDVANLVNRCFGGTSTPWSNAYKPNNVVCGYGENQSYLAYTPGAAYNLPGAGYYEGKNPQDPLNGTAGYPGLFNYPYTPYSNGLPIQLYLQFNVKL